MAAAAAAAPLIVQVNRCQERPGCQCPAAGLPAPACVCHCHCSCNMGNRNPPIMAQQQVRMVQVQIDPTTVLTYNKPQMFATPTSNQKAKMAVYEPYSFMVEEGLKVQIGQNEYILVTEFVDSVNAMSANPVFHPNIELVIGTSYVNELGDVIELKQTRVVELPKNCTIRLPTGTKLQQPGVPVQLTLGKEITATVR